MIRIKLINDVARGTAIESATRLVYDALKENEGKVTSEPSDNVAGTRSNAVTLELVREILTKNFRFKNFEYSLPSFKLCENGQTVPNVYPTAVASFNYAESLRHTFVHMIARGLSQNQMKKELESLGVKTFRDKAWHVTQVRRIIKKLGLKGEQK